MSWTNGDLIFIVALALAVLVPIALSVRAGRQWESQSVPVTSWREGRSRGPKAPGYHRGVGTGIISVFAVPWVLDLVQAPVWLAGALLLSAFVIALLVHTHAKPAHDFFGALAWGMVLGAFILPCLIGLVVLPILALAGL